MHVSASPMFPVLYLLKQSHKVTNMPQTNKCKTSEQVTDMHRLFVARSLSEDGAKAVVNAFISCRLDYCNSLLSGVSDCLVQRLQSVQNAAARFVTGTRRCEHITPVLRRLHWLPVRERIRYKLLALVHRALSGQAPEYLVDDCQLVSDSGRRPLRSAERSFCLVPRCNSTFGDRSFAVAGPRLWNSLPTAIRNISLTIHTFGKHLKTHLFSG